MSFKKNENSERIIEHKIGSDSIIHTQQNVHLPKTTNSNTIEGTHKRTLVQHSTAPQCIPVHNFNSNSDSPLNYDSSDVENGIEIDESSFDSWGN